MAAHELDDRLLIDETVDAIRALAGVPAPVRTGDTQLFFEQLNMYVDARDLELHVTAYPLPPIPEERMYAVAELMNLLACQRVPSVFALDLDRRLIRLKNGALVGLPDTERGPLICDLVLTVTDALHVYTEPLAMVVTGDVEPEQAVAVVERIADAGYRDAAAAAAVVRQLHESVDAGARKAEPSLRDTHATSALEESRRRDAAAAGDSYDAAVESSAARLKALLFPTTWSGLTTLIVACIGAAVGLARFGISGGGAAGAVFLATVAVLVVTNMRARIYPNLIVIPAYIIVLAMTLIAAGLHTTLIHLYAGLGFGVALLLVALLWPAAIGMGDVKVAALIGFGVGRGVLYAVPIAITATLVLGVVALIRRPTTLRSRGLPTWPILVCAATAALMIHGL